MSGESSDVGAIARVEHDGRVLSGGTDVDQLTETMERHAPSEPSEKPLGSEKVAPQPAAAGSPDTPAAPQPMTRGRQRFSDLTREREEARAEAAAAKAEKERIERELQDIKAKAQPAAPAREPEAKPAVEPAKPAERFPAFEKWLETKGNEEKDFQDYLTAFNEHYYQQRRAAERAEQSAAEEQRTVEEHMTAYRAKHVDFVKAHPDFDTVVGAKSNVSAVMARAALEGGPELAYYLATHDTERTELDADTRYVGPSDPSFKSIVATTKRYLTALIAAEQKGAAKPAQVREFTPPPAPHPTVGASTPTTAKSSADYAKEGDVDAYRKRRAAERGVKPRY